MQVSDAVEQLLVRNMQAVLVNKDHDNPGSMLVLATSLENTTQDWYLIRVSEFSYEVLEQYSNLHTAIQAYNTRARNI